MEGHKESGAGQPAASIGDTPAPGTLAETNALLRELLTHTRVIAACMPAVSQLARGSGGIGFKPPGLDYGAAPLQEEITPLPVPGSDPR